MGKSFILFIFYFCLAGSLYAQDSSLKSMQTITPVEYFSSGSVSYYFGYDGIREFYFDNKTYKYKDIISYNNKAYGKPSLNKILGSADEVYYLKDGSIMINKSNSDYSCIDSANENCLYAPVFIRKINKKSLHGRISLYKIDENIPLEEKDTVDFPLGSYLYSVVVDVPAYDFSTFNDFDSLVCTK